MSRFLQILLVPLALTLLLAAGCDRKGSDTLVLTGSVVDDAISIPVPEIPLPTPDIEAGFSQEGTPSVALDKQRSSSSFERPEYAWLRVQESPVRPGDRVNAGDALTIFDGSLLSADVDQAMADQKAAEADLAALGVALSEASTGLQDVESQQTELSELVTDLQQQRVEILVDLEAARKLVGSPVPTGTPDPAEKVVELEAALAEVDKGINQANEALARLDEGMGELGDVVSVLEGAQRAAKALVDIRQIMVQMAELRLEQATVRSPAAGLVLDASLPGAVLTARAPAATIRPDTPITVTTWITAEQRELITLGAGATVGSDSLGDETVSGAVTDIGSDYVYVPTTFGTKVIHLIRAFEVKIVIYGDGALPPGTPVDVTIQTIGSTGL